jgi:predicted amidohydrolase YtcJ
VAGPLDRAALDAVIDDVPVRVQDRSGALWVVNSRGISALGLADADEPGIERDGAGRPTGRLFRMDAWLRGRTGEDREEDLGAEVARVSREAAARGVTGLTDATPGLTPAELEWWGRVAADHLLQRLTLMWSPDRGLGDPPPGVQAGPVKVLLDDVDLPVPDELAGWIDDAHRTGRPVAVHCVTRAQTVVAVAALAGAGSVAGDRIEHGSLIPAEILPELARLGITVVTNPSLIHDRGDRYLEDVDPADRGDLYRCASLIEAGVAVGAGTDAPFGSADPWVSVRAAASRRTAGGEVLGPGEAVSAWRALTLFTGRPDAPSTPRRVAAGEPADLVVLDRPLSELAGLTGGEVRTDLGLLSADRVRATVVAGRVVYERAITA